MIAFVNYLWFNIFCLDTVLSVGRFFGGNVVIVLGIVVWLVDVFVFVVVVFYTGDWMVVVCVWRWEIFLLLSLFVSS